MNLCFIRTRYVYTTRKRVKRKLWYPLEREKLNRAPTFYTFQPRALFLLEREIERRGEWEWTSERRDRDEKFNFKKIPPPPCDPETRLDTISSFERLFHVLPPSSVVDDEGTLCCDCSDEKNLKKRRERKRGRRRRRELRAWRRFSRARLSRVSSTLQISLS